MQTLTVRIQYKNTFYIHWTSVPIPVSSHKYELRSMKRTHVPHDIDSKQIQEHPGRWHGFFTQLLTKKVGNKGRWVLVFWIRSSELLVSKLRTRLHTSCYSAAHSGHSDWDGVFRWYQRFHHSIWRRKHFSAKITFQSLAAAHITRSDDYITASRTR